MTLHISACPSLPVPRIHHAHRLPRRVTGNARSASLVIKTLCCAAVRRLRTCHTTERVIRCRIPLDCLPTAIGKRLLRQPTERIVLEINHVPDTIRPESLFTAHLPAPVQELDVLIGRS